MAPRRRTPRDRSEVSLCIKYLLFSFNVFFWIVGLGVLAIGVFAWVEKQMFQNIGELSNFFIDPGLIFMIVGAVIFIIGFAGCVGALRENTCLLMFFILCLVIILLCQVTVAVLLFVYKDWVMERISQGLEQYIERYRDDADLQNIIDWVQDSWMLAISSRIDDALLARKLEWKPLPYFDLASKAYPEFKRLLYCCGVNGPGDWEKNIYFSCDSPSRESCGVPFSCCKVEIDDIINLQCGYDVRTDELKSSWGDVIYDTGCIPAAEAWIDNNIIPVAGTAVGIAVVEIMGICFAHNLRQDIFAQKAKWHKR